MNDVTPTDVGSRSDVNMHHPQTAAAGGDTRGPGTAKYFLKNNLIIFEQTCSVGTDHGYGYGYGYEAMGMGTGTGSRPCVWVRVRVRDHAWVRVWVRV